MLVTNGGAKNRQRVWFWSRSANRNQEVRQLQGGEETAPIAERLDVGEQVQSGIPASHHGADGQVQLR